MAPSERYFAWQGGAKPANPVILAVPHAGRNYPAPLIAASAVPVGSLRRLEDRYADLLVERAVAAGYPALVARIARAWVDLNRDPDDREGGAKAGKWRVGLGIFPSAMAGCGPLWRASFAASDLAERIAAVHQPYHRAIAEALAERRARFGAAMLLDVHSMPRHAGRGWPRSADIVLGDAKGSTTSRSIANSLAEAVRAAGLSCARNVPYAGGYGVTAHAAPALGIHGLQIEIARDLYLDASGAPDVRGVATIGALLCRLADHAAKMMREAGMPSADAAE